MKKPIIAIIALVSFLIMNMPTYGMSIPEGISFTIQTPDIDKCYFFVYEDDEITSETNIVEFVKDRVNPEYVDCENLSLTEEEQGIFRDVINQFNIPINHDTDRTHNFYFKKQTDEEHEKFVKTIEEATGESCLKYEDIERHGDWSSYAIKQTCHSDIAYDEPLEETLIDTSINKNRMTIIIGGVVLALLGIFLAMKSRE